MNTDEVVKMLDFGSYCCIEQKRHAEVNETYMYKVIGRGMANYYRKVPVDSMEPNNTTGELTEVVKVICCGVDETKVETFRLQDVRPRNFN